MWIDARLSDVSDNFLVLITFQYSKKICNYYFQFLARNSKIRFEIHLFSVVTFTYQFSGPTSVIFFSPCSSVLFQTLYYGSSKYITVELASVRKRKRFSGWGKSGIITRPILYCTLFLINSHHAMHCCRRLSS